MRKVGYFFSGFLPILVATAIQLLATFFLMGIAMISLLITKGSFSVDILLNMFADSYFSTGIMVIYSITCIVLFGLYYYHACGGEYLPKPSKTFDILQILGIVVLIPGAQFACSYLIGIVSMVFPQWLKQYQDLIDSCRTYFRHYNCNVMLFHHSGTNRRRIDFPRCYHAACPQSIAFLACQHFSGSDVWYLPYELDSGHLCICTRPSSWLCV